MLWLIQGNLDKNDGLKRMTEILSAKEIPFKLVKSIPFSNIVVDIDVDINQYEENNIPKIQINDKNCVVFGSYSLALFAKENNFNPGGFINENYEYSKWLKGWGNVVFELDHEKIQQNFEIKPFSWNYLFKHVKNIKKHEFEEFIISHYFNKSIPDLKREQEERDNLIDQLIVSLRDIKDQEQIKNINKEIETLEKIPSWFKIWEGPKGINLNLNNCLKGIYVEDFLLKEYKLFEKDLSILIEHKLFKGTFSRENLSNKNNIKLKA